MIKPHALIGDGTSTTKIHCTAIGVDAGLRAQLAAIAKVVPDLRFDRMLESSPGSDALARFLRSNTAPIVFLNAARVDEATKIAAVLESHDPSLQIIAVLPPKHQTVPMALIRAGFREYLEQPLQPSAVAEAVERCTRVLNKLPTRNRVTGCFYSFLPAKAGVGASTLAASVSTLLSSDHGRSTVLADFDTTSGTVAFRYRIDPLHGVVEALARAEQLDDELWDSLSSRSDRLDILPSNFRSVEAVDSARVIKLLEFIRGRYERAVFDFSGNMEAFTFDIMHESTMVYLVCTQELDCLHLARAKAATLRSLNVDDKVRVLINRFHKNHPLTSSHIEDLLQLKVDTTFPNEYKTVETSLASSAPIDTRTALGKSLAMFAAQLLEKEPEVKKHRFLEFLKLPAFQHWAQMTSSRRD